MIVDRRQSCWGLPEEGTLYLYGKRMPQPDGQSAGHALAEDRDLGFQAKSVGVRVLKGEPVALASAALEEVGIYVEDHRTRQVSETMLKGTSPCSRWDRGTPRTSSSLWGFL